MGSACASTLALMDGGVPIKAPVAGIAIGSVTHNGINKVMTDIQGPEMSLVAWIFKVAAHTAGLPLFNSTLNSNGIPLEVSRSTRRRQSRTHSILEVIEKNRRAARQHLASGTEIIVMRSTRPIGLSSGAVQNNQRYQDATKVDDITIEDDGSVFITAKWHRSKAREMIER